MTPELTGEAWAQVRHDYEYTDRPVEDICAEHGISSGTLRNRMRRWSWTRRRPPIPLLGPPPAPALPVATAAPFPAAAPQIAAGGEARAPDQPDLVQDLAQDVAPDVATNMADDAAIVPRLQGALGRVLPAIEAAVATLAAAPAHPRELERAARALAALTRTLRELNDLLRQHRAAAAAADPGDDAPVDLDALRRELARRIDALADAHTRATLGCASPQEV